MPHSGGGGSHGGGFHGGSFGGGSHRGGSYRGGGHGHYYGGRSYRSGFMARVSRRDFFGSKKFVYYKNNKPNYFFSDRVELGVRSDERATYIFVMVLALIILASALFVELKGFLPKHRIDANYIADVYVDDKIYVIDNEKALEDKFEEFYDLTGITPVLITVNYESWNINYKNPDLSSFGSKYYGTLSDYAYDKYLSLFNDEYHMLIVYSEPAQSTSSFGNWSWELMQGNNTDVILTESVDNRFGKALNKGLSDKNVSVEDAVINAFDEIMPNIMKAGQGNRKVSVFNLFLAAFMAFIEFAFWNNAFGPKYYKIKNAVKCRKNAREENCKSCGGVYAVGSVTDCPYCGTALPVKKEKGTITEGIDAPLEEQRIFFVDDDKETVNLRKD